MTTFYIATTLENAIEHNRCRDQLRELEHEITYDWTLRSYEVSRQLAEVAWSEVAGVLAADYLVVLLPGGIGTHVELGVALGAHIPIYLVAGASQLIDHRGWPFPFYHHAQVTQVSDIGGLVRQVERRDA